MTYGMPYCGSKNRIAMDVIEILPKARVLVDLFAGGCAITHAALMSGRYDCIIANDVTDIAGFFGRAVRGEIPEPPRFVSREEFFAKKDIDPLIKMVWSFGNKGTCYCIAREKEELLRSCVGAPCVTGDAPCHGCVFEKARKHCQARKVYSQTQRIMRLREMKGSASKLVTMRADYTQVPIPCDAIVYADPPYEGAVQPYTGERFDSHAFLEWASACPVPVYVSERDAPDGWVCLFGKELTISMAANSNNQKRIERLFIHEKWVSASAPYGNARDKNDPAG